MRLFLHFHLPITCVRNSHGVDTFLPHAETGPAVAVPPVIPEERKQQRVEAWVDRELRALLQTDDIAIVRAYVMGLVRGIGFAARQVCCTVRILLNHPSPFAGSPLCLRTLASHPFFDSRGSHSPQLGCFSLISFSALVRPWV